MAVLHQFSLAEVREAIEERSNRRDQGILSLPAVPAVSLSLYPSISLSPALPSSVPWPATCICNPPVRRSLSDATFDTFKEAQDMTGRRIALSLLVVSLLVGQLNCNGSRP